MTTASVVYSDNDQLIERAHGTRPDGSICRVWYSLSRGGVEQLRTEFPLPPAVSAAFPEGVMRFPEGDGCISARWYANPSAIAGSQPLQE